MSVFDPQFIGASPATPLFVPNTPLPNMRAAPDTSSWLQHAIDCDRVVSRVVVVTTLALNGLKMVTDACHHPPPPFAVQLCGGLCACPARRVRARSEEGSDGQSTQWDNVDQSHPWSRRDSQTEPSNLLQPGASTLNLPVVNVMAH